MLPLSIGQFDVMQILGNAENIDLDMLTGRKHTLIIWLFIDILKYKSHLKDALFLTSQLLEMVILINITFYDYRSMWFNSLIINMLIQMTTFSYVQF